MTLPLRIVPRPGLFRRVLGIDLGTTSGWSVVDAGRATSCVAAGLWKLGSGPERMCAFRDEVGAALEQWHPRYVAFELANFHKGENARRVYYGLLGVLEAEVVAYRSAAVLVDLVEVRPSEVKARATGKGNAEKGAIVEAAREWVGREVDHNEADAIFVALRGADLTWSAS